jgi:hypothetical protein
MLVRPVLWRRGGTVIALQAALSPGRGKAGSKVRPGTVLIPSLLS